MPSLDPEPFDPVIEALLTDERELPAVSADARARVNRRVAATLALGAGVGAARVASAKSVATTGAAKTIAAVAVAGALAATMALTAGRRSPPDVAPPPPPASAPPAAEPLVELPPPVVAAEPDPTEEPRAAAGTRGRATGDIMAEKALLDVARSALQRKDIAAATRALARHQARWPRGVLVEEREALRVQALLFGGDRASAAAQAGRFHRRFPLSIQNQTIDGLLERTP